MRIAVLQPALPPRIDGVGDHTARLAVELGKEHDVHVLGLTPADRDQFPGVSLALTDDRLPRAVRTLLSEVHRLRPDWLLVQYTGFAYGAHGINPHLVPGLLSLRRAGIKIALLAHEAFVPPRGPKHAVLSAAQASQFFLVGRTAHRVLVSTEDWSRRFGGWFGRDRVSFMRIGSNVPRCSVDVVAARRLLGVEETATVGIVFGGLGAHRDPGVLRAGLEALATAPEPVAIYVGPDSQEFRGTAQGLRLELRLLERVSGNDVSTAFACANIALAPFIDGVSSRRSSFLAGLQHGVATVTTSGPLMGPTLRQAAEGGAFAAVPYGASVKFGKEVRSLVVDPRKRDSMGARGQAFFERTRSWPVIVTDVTGALVDPLSKTVT